MSVKITMSNEEIEKDAASAAKKHSFSETKEIESFIESVSKVLRESEN